MKINKYAIIAELFFALLLSSCQKAEDIYPEVGKGCKFTVSAIEETKAIRQNDSEGSIYWSGKENFWLSTNQTQNPVQVTVDVPEPVATISFVADLPSVPSEQHPVWVTSAVSSNLKDGVLNVSIKGAKEVADNFPAVAFSTSRNLKFRNICGGVSFTVANTGISSVDFSGNGGEPLAGNVKVKLNEKGNPVCEVVNDSDLCSSVSLNAPDVEKGFEVGKKYYIDLLPCALSKGFTMTFHKKDGTFAEYKTDKPNTVSRSKYGTLADLDKDLAFGNGEEDTFSITPDKFDVDAIGGDVTFTVTSSIGYKVTNNNPDWITEVSVKDGPTANSKVYTYSVAKNEQTKARTGIIVVCNDNEVCIPVTVNQKGKSDEPDDDWINKEFAHKSLAMRFTATWCGYCPNLARAIHDAQQQMPGEIEVLNLHGGGSDLEFSQNYLLEDQFLITGFPTGVLDGRRYVENYGREYAAQLVVDYVNETKNNYPTVSGVSFESSTSGQTLTVDIKAYLKKAGSYKIAAFVTESGIIGYQADNYEGSHSNYEHNDIARIALSNALGDSFTIASDGQTKDFSYKATIPSGYNKNNLKILVFIMRAYGSQPVLRDNSAFGDYYVDNCASGKVGDDLPLAFKSDTTGGSEGIGDGGEIKW